MTWTNKLWKFGETPDDTDMTAMQADITAKANGDAGAPKNQLASMASNSVDTNQIVAAAVSQGKLSTAVGVGSVFVSSFLQARNGALSGGEYSFYPRHYVLNSGYDSEQLVAAAVYDSSVPTWIGFNATSYTTNFGLLYNSQPNTAYYSNRYIQASPPYDLGDGECHLFTFIAYDPDGNIIATHSAPDAPWHYSGPTDIRGARWKTVLTGDGYDYRELAETAAFVRRLLHVDGNPTPQQVAALQEWLEILPLLPRISVNEPVPQVVKNADMALVPHPWVDTLPEGCTVVLLDPVSDLSRQLADLQRREEISMAQMIHAGFFRIGTAALSRVSPPGVKTVSYRWQ